MSVVLDEMKTRRSIRKFKPDMVPADVLDQIIEAGTFAANGRGLQSPIIIAVTNKKMRDKIMEMNRMIGGWEEGFDPFYGAPVILIVLADASCPTAVYDGSLTMGNLMLAAHDLGSIVQKKNSKAKKESRSLKALESPATISVSDIAHLDLRMERILMLFQERITEYTIFAKQLLTF